MSSFELLRQPYISRPDHRRNYSRVSGRAVPVPDVVIRLRAVGGGLPPTPVLFTVDSGADVTILPKRHAAYFGFRLDGVRPRRGRAAGGATYDYLDNGWDVEADLCGKWTRIPVRFFASDQARRALLGRDGAFDALELVFVQARRVIYARQV